MKQMRRTTVIRQASRALIVILVIITISTIVPTMTYAADTPWKEIEGWTQYSTPTLADINGDGKLEVFVPTNKGKIYGFYENGTAISGWPISLDGRYIASSPAVGDINGDGNVEVVVAGGFAAQPGIVAAYTAAGQKLWELIPAPNLQTTNNGAGGVFASPVLADLNADERLDVLISTYDENIYAINGSTGGPLFPPGLTNHNGALINMGDSIWATPAVGDVDGDGSPDIVVASATNHFVASVFGWTGATSACTKNNSITNPDPRACGIVAVYSNTGVLKPGWPKFMAGQTYDASPALVDVNKDGKLEIVTGNGWDPTYGDATQPFYVTIWNYDGTVRARYDVKTEVFNSPAIGDITGDSQPEIVVTTSDRVAGTTSYQRRIFAFDLNMNLLSGFPKLMTPYGSSSPSNAGPPTLADLNGDGKAEIIVGNSDFQLRAIDGSGAWRDDLLLIYTGLPIASQATVADVDADGKIELFVASGYQANWDKGAIFRKDFNVTAKGTGLPWAQFHGNAYHTGYYPVPELQVPDTAHFVTTTGRQHHVTIQVRDTTGGGIAWTAQVLSGGTWITLNQSSGTTPSNLIMTLTSDLAGLAVPQSQATGTVRITADTLTKDINVSLVLASTLEEVWLPFITR